MSFAIEYQQTDYIDVYGWILEDGVKSFGHKRIEAKDITSDLEKTIKSLEKIYPISKDSFSKGTYNSGPGKYDKRKDIVDFVNSTNEHRLIEKDFLGEGILGMYIPSTDTLYVVKNLEPAVKAWVKEHEFAHRLMQYLGIKQSERLADWIATQKTGFNPFPGRLENNNLYRIISREIADYTNRYRRRTNIHQLPQKRTTYKPLEAMDIRYGKAA